MIDTCPLRVMFALLIVSAPLTSRSQIQLLQDINQMPVEASDPTYLIANGTSVLFSMTDPEHGRELWTSDGAPTGTHLVKDIFPGNNDGLSGNPMFSSNGGVFYFVASDAAISNALWRTNGTASGTFRVSSGCSNVAHLTVMNGLLYFSAAGISGQELWRSDGTSTGTSMVQDIEIGQSGSNPSQLVVMNNVLYFLAYTSTFATQVWKSDGTTFGTQLLSTSLPTDGSASPGNLTVAGNTLYFMADDGATGRQLRRSNGTVGDVVHVINADINGSYSVNDMVGLPNGHVMFGANFPDVPPGPVGNELWTSDGTTISLVKDINSNGNAGSFPYNLSVHFGKVYFSALDVATGDELWVSDATEAGTGQVANINPGNAWSNVGPLTEYNGLLYFQATTGSEGHELWSSDGLVNGNTTMLKDMINGPNGGYPTYIVGTSNALFMSAQKVGGSNKTVWTSNGTPSQTIQLAVPPPSNATCQANQFTGVGAVTYFTADNGTNGNELWSTDGTPAGTHLVKDIESGIVGSYPFILGQLNGEVYFRATTTANGSELWKSDGTLIGTVLVKDIQPDGAGSYPSNAFELNGKLIFRAIDGLAGAELWSTDGTAANTQMISPGSTGQGPVPIGKVNGVVLFTSWDLAHGNELWITNGTPAGTLFMYNVNPDAGDSFIQGIKTLGGYFYFNAFNGSQQNTWSTDGATLGTVPFLFPFDVSDITQLGSAFCFIGNDGLSGPLLYSSDGTLAGNQLLSTAYAFGQLTTVGSSVYFNGYEGTTGVEVHVSDGTSSGTTILKDIAPGGESSYSSNLMAHESSLYFTSLDGNGSRSVWRSDGTAATTWKIGTPTQAMDPLSLFSTSQGLFISAISDSNGHEPFVYHREGNLGLRAFLEGPYDAIAGKMTDQLRANNLIPLTEPYTALGFVQLGSGGEMITPDVLATTGNDAIVDWVEVELRSSADASMIEQTLNALLQRDGDVVGLNGTTPVELGATGTSHYIAIQHRNHLGVMSFAAIGLSATSAGMDFTLAGTPAYGSLARKNISGTMVLWDGDVRKNNDVKYTGANNDRDPILVRIGGTTPTATTSGYHMEDVNLDGIVKYTGAHNDRDPILVNIGGTVPTAIKLGTLP